jgi:hypothetical protein
VNGLRVGKVAFAPLPSESGETVPVAFGTLAWKNGDVHGMSVFIKATFDMSSTPMRSATPDPIAAMDIVPRKPLADVVVSPAAKARAGEAALVIKQRGTTLLDVKRSCVVGKSHGLEPVFATPGSADAMQCALVDQRVPMLDADAQIFVSGVFANRPSVAAQLPSARAVGVLFGVNPNGPEHPTVLSFKADTVFIDPLALRLSIVWRAELPLHGPFDLGLLTVGAGVATHDHPLRLRKRLIDLEIELGGAASSGGATVVLPQSGPAGAAAPAPKARATGRSSVGKRQELRTVIAQVAAEPAEKALPFDRSAKATPPARAAGTARATGKGATLPIGSSRGDDAKKKTIPFVTDKDRARAQELEEARTRDLAEREARGRAERAEAERRADEERAAEERRADARRVFESEQLRLKQLELDRKELAAKLAKEQAQKLDEGLYGGFGKKKK